MKKRIFSGIQPSGNLHIGNYLGAIKNWVKLQDEFDCVYCIVDLHAITVPQDPVNFRGQVIEIAKILLASGINPEKSKIFIQSHLCEHSELAWILNTIAKNGDLSKMIQFRDKALNFGEISEASSSEAVKEASKKLSPDNIEEIAKYAAFQTAQKYFQEYKEQFNSANVGLFNYPVLMAADILLYDAEVVPVGEDQFQHVELTRTLANRFNKRFGETFKIPGHYKTEEGMRIMGLDDPTKKMSKSAGSEYNYIALTDDEDTIRKKIKKAVTDSGSEIKYAEEKPALYNLINIYSSFTAKKPDEIEKMYEGKGYAEFKDGLSEAIIEGLKPIQEKMKLLTDEEVLNILKEGAEKVRPIAKRKLDEVKEKIGFIL